MWRWEGPLHFANESGGCACIFASIQNATRQRIGLQQPEFVHSWYARKQGREKIDWFLCGESKLPLY
jgi:hypothetical protein